MKVGIQELVQRYTQGNNKHSASFWSSVISEITFCRAWIWTEITKDPNIEPRCSNTCRLNEDKEATRQIWEQPVSQKGRVDWLAGNQAALLSKKKKWFIELSKVEIQNCPWQYGDYKTLNKNPFDANVRWECARMRVCALYYLPPRKA